MKEFIQSSVGYFLGFILFIVAWPFGMYHAFTSHGIGHSAFSFVVPPYAWYMSVEYFWHEEDKYIQVKKSEGTVDSLIEFCRDNTKEYERSGLTRLEYNLFCSCYWTKTVAKYPGGYKELDKGIFQECIKMAKQ